MTKPAHVQYAEKLMRHLMWELGSMGFTADDMADHVGGSPRTYENYRYESTPTLAGFFGLLRMARPPETIRKIAEQCGGGYFIVPALNGLSETADLVRGTSEIMKQTSDVLTALAESLSDGKLSIPERARLSKEINEAIEALLKTKLCVENGKATDASR